MAYLEHDHIQLLEKIMGRYKIEFPYCDLTKEAEKLELAAAFKKDAYTEEIKGDVLNYIEGGMCDEEHPLELTEIELENITYRVMKWMDYSDLNETISEAIAEEVRNRQTV